MNTPLYKHMKNYSDQNRISFAMPGHKNGRGLPSGLMECDVTELDATENLHSPGEIIKRSQQLISQKYASDKSYILTCGSTAGIQSMLAAALNPGELLLSTPDCHISVINTCALLGIQLMFMPMKYDEYGHCTDFDFDGIENLLKSGIPARAAIAVSPDYYGISKNIKKMAELCHSFGIPLLTDQAHGAHFAVSDIFPPTAVVSGSDCTVMSAHKTLNALTGAAYLHVCGNMVDRQRLQRTMSMFQTSSPSYPIAVSAETAALTMNASKWEETAQRCAALKKSVGLVHLENDDPTRLVFFTGSTTGYDAEKILAERFAIDIEMADILSIVLIATPSNTAEDFERLLTALNTFAASKPAKIPYLLQPPAGIFSPAKGFYSCTENIGLTDSLGKTAACTVTAYPPGIPIICCGAMITRSMLEAITKLINTGAKLKGLDDNRQIRIIATERSENNDK